MPRMPRRFEEGRVYHVYNRFSRGEPIFEETVEVGRFLDLLSEVKQTDGFALLAFCILPTHYHIAFRQGPVSLSRTMRSLQGRFSQSFNIRHRRTGPVWQSRFKAERGTAGFGPRPPRGVGQSSVEPRESKTGGGPGVCPTLRGPRPGSGRKGGEGKQVT